jgi:cystathionine beta-lyase/cystathionine gamma-synthase
MIATIEEKEAGIASPANGDGHRPPLQKNEYEFETLALHAGTTADPVTGAMLTPIYQTTTYRQEAVGKDKGFKYSRSGNPTVAALERRLAALEGAEFCSCYSTGLAATSALFLALLKRGDRVVSSQAVYGGTVRLLRQTLEPFGVETDFVDTSDEVAFAKAVQKNTKLIFIETPANPTLKLTDIDLAARLAKQAGALLVVDNTLLTPALQRPLDLGADVVLHSTTKFIEGHNATVGGALITRDVDLHEKFLFTRNTIGAIQSPFAAWLTLQGVKTLPLRMKQHCDNALRVAHFLQKHPRVAKLSYPGLESFPQFDLAKRQQSDGGALISFELKGGVDAGIQLMNSVKLCALAENLGAAETIITHPVSMTHESVPPEQRAAAGITDGLVRLSVGLENPDDIIVDLARAFDGGAR